MKKSILCVAIGTLMASTAMAAAPEESIQNAFSSLLKNQLATSEVILPTKVSVIPDGDNFNVILSNPKQPTVPERTVRLIRSGEFNGRPQYQVETPLDHIISVLKDTVPDISISTQKTQSTLMWVPEYNLVTQNSHNIQGLQVSYPNVVDVSVAQSVMDSLVQITEENKMNRADIHDVSDIRITANGMTLSIPSVSYQDSIIGVPVSDTIPDLILSSEDAHYQLSIPTLFLLPTQGVAPLVSMAVTTAGSYKNDVFHWDLNINDIVIDSNLYAGVPGVLIPSHIGVDFDISGLNRAEIRSLSAETEPKPEAIQATLTKWLKDIVIHLNRIEAKNANGGIAVSGTIRDISPQKLPEADLTVVVTNLDKLSPVPTVDQARCDEANARLNAVDINNPDADAQKRAASFAVAQACQPQGGVLDDLRPFVEPEKRVTQADGSTLDTIQLQLHDGVLNVNGQPLVDLGMMMGLNSGNSETGTEMETETKTEPIADMVLETTEVSEAM